MSTFKRLSSFIVFAAVLSLPLLLFWKVEAITDWWKLHGYSPPASVSRLADSDAMTAQGRHFFYLNHPKIMGQVAQLHQECPQSEQTIVLGCYHSNEEGIALYAVKDTRLEGVKEVTAAHEMLHAAYDRLSDSEKERINGLLNDYYENNLHDERIIKTINLYKQSEPKDVVNEMHSVFGTEVANLPSALESYYKNYFFNRAAVVGFAQGYENEFTSRLNRIDAYDKELSALKHQITEEEQALDAKFSQIEKDRSTLDALRSSGQTEQYNAAVTSFNGEVADYNQSLSKLRADIATYNQSVSTRNAIASELRSLDSAIDTRLTTQAAQ